MRPSAGESELLTLFLACKITLLLPLFYFYLTDNEDVGSRTGFLWVNFYANIRTSS